MPEVLGKKTEELIAVGVAYAINCVKCMKVHRKAAINEGVSAKEMNEALSVAESVLNGARGVTKNEAEAIFGNEIMDTLCCPEDSDCCT